MDTFMVVFLSVFEHNSLIFILVHWALKISQVIFPTNPVVSHRRKKNHKTGKNLRANT